MNNRRRTLVVLDEEVERKLQKRFGKKNKEAEAVKETKRTEYSKENLYTPMKQHKIIDDEVMINVNAEGIYQTPFKTPMHLNLGDSINRNEDLFRFDGVDRFEITPIRVPTSTRPLDSSGLHSNRLEKTENKTEEEKKRKIEDFNDFDDSIVVNLDYNNQDQNLEEEKKIEEEEIKEEEKKEFFDDSVQVNLNDSFDLEEQLPGEILIDTEKLNSFNKSVLMLDNSQNEVRCESPKPIKETIVDGSSSPLDSPRNLLISRNLPKIYNLTKGRRSLGNQTPNKNTPEPVNSTVMSKKRYSLNEKNTPLQFNYPKLNRNRLSLIQNKKRLSLMDESSTIIDDNKESEEENQKMESSSPNTLIDSESPESNDSIDQFEDILPKYQTLIVEIEPISLPQVITSVDIQSPNPSFFTFEFSQICPVSATITRDPILLEQIRNAQPYNGVSACQSFVQKHSEKVSKKEQIRSVMQEFSKSHIEKSENKEKIHNVLSNFCNLHSQNTKNLKNHENYNKSIVVVQKMARSFLARKTLQSLKQKRELKLEKLETKLSNLSKLNHGGSVFSSTYDPSRFERLSQLFENSINKIQKMSFSNQENKENFSQNNQLSLLLEKLDSLNQEREILLKKSSNTL